MGDISIMKPSGICRFKNLYTLIFAMALMSSFVTSAVARSPRPYCTDGRALPGWTKTGIPDGMAGRDKMMYGLGVASKISDQSLLTETSDNRAIAELAKAFSTKIKELMVGYPTATSPSGQGVKQDAGTTVNETLNGVIIVDRCKDAKRGISYSLAGMDAKAFKDSLENRRELDGKMKAYLSANAEKAFKNQQAPPATRKSPTAGTSGQKR